jgi:hypothetical protein
MDDVLKLVFEDAIDIARTAKTELSKAPVVRSKRGGPQTSSWLRVWTEAVQNAVRLARLLKDSDDPLPSLDEELENLLDRGES